MFAVFVLATALIVPEPIKVPGDLRMTRPQNEDTVGLVETQIWLEENLNEFQRATDEMLPLIQREQRHWACGEKPLTTFDRKLWLLRFETLQGATAKLLRRLHEDPNNPKLLATITKEFLNLRNLLPEWIQALRYDIAATALRECPSK